MRSRVLRVAVECRAQMGGCPRQIFFRAELAGRQQMSLGESAPAVALRNARCL